jgi:hypothetical protein
VPFLIGWSAPFVLVEVSAADKSAGDDRHNESASDSYDGIEHSVNATIGFSLAFSHLGSRLLLALGHLGSRLSLALGHLSPRLSLLIPQLSLPLM